MDFWTDIGFTVVLRLLKNKKQAQQFQAALYKLHGKIEEVFPELQPDNRKDKSSGS